MKRLRYCVAMSLDGFIAGPKGEYDWIVTDPDFDWKGLYGQFDTLLMGRGTYDTMRERGMSSKGMGMQAYVVSTTLSQDESGKDIWLMGGGKLFRSLLDAGLVDAVDVTIEPVLLGSGVPLVPEGQRCHLKLTECKPRPNGIVTLKYEVAKGAFGA